MQSALISQLESNGLVLGQDERSHVLSAAQDLLDSNIALRALQIGEEAPNVRLLEADGTAFTLSEALLQGPMVLTFFRGRWCSFCRRYLSEIQEKQQTVVDAGARIIAASPQTPAESRETQRRLGLTFPVLSDPDNAAAEAFGLAYTLPTGLRWAYEQLGIDLPRHNGESSFRLPVPATYVIGADRRIRDARVDPDYTRRPSVDSLTATLV